MPTKPQKLVPFDRLKPDYGLAVTKRRINQLVAEGKFPAPVRPGRAANARPAWIKEEIEAYIADLVKTRDRAAERARA